MGDARFDPYDQSHLERLRGLARDVMTVAEIVSHIRSTVAPDAAFTLLVLKSLMVAFDLSLREARRVELAPCMGNAAATDEEIDQLLRPLILRSVQDSKADDEES